MPCTLAYACLSDPGRSHAENQDRWFADPVQALYVVADGMADELPAQLVVDRLPALLFPSLAGVRRLTDPGAGDQIQEALTSLNEQARELNTTGSTVVLALVRGRHALIAHLGDSRAYLFREGRLDRLTRDHSWVEEMLDTGTLTPEEAARALSNGGPTRFIGMWGEPAAAVRLVELQPGDRLLLCSDGLTCMMADEEMQQILRRSSTPEDACQQLIAAANDAGGEDNITALIVAVSA
jgi:protein phosphatase